MRTKLYIDTTADNGDRRTVIDECDGWKAEIERRDPLDPGATAIYTYEELGDGTRVGRSYHSVRAFWALDARTRAGETRPGYVDEALR